MYESKSNAELRHKLIKAKAITTLAEEESRERNPQAPQHSVINLLSDSVQQTKVEPISSWKLHQKKSHFLGVVVGDQCVQTQSQGGRHHPWVDCPVGSAQ